MELTKKQREVWDYIQNYNTKNGYSPTQKEIKDHFGLKSYGSVQRYLKYLKEANLIDMHWNARRGIVLLNQEQVTPMASISNEVEVPLLGNIAAGDPILAIESSSEFVSVPSHMIKDNHNYFALKIVGDSMIEDGILDGDVILAKQQNDADPKQTIVAIVNEEATLKRYHPKKDLVELHPANRNYQPIIVNNRDTFKIAGVLSGLLRSFD